MLKDNIIKFPKENNLELLRLIFALQVVISHMSSHLEFPIPSFISYFPGVPAFFFVSGLLIYTSYLNAPGKKYLTNRFLRLFPGLLIVTAGGILLILFAKGYPFIRENLPIIITWSFSQITIGQAFNPSIFRDIGVGVINGSLWTITVEIIFYLVVPIIVLFEKRIKFFVWYLSATSLLIYSFGEQELSMKIYRDKSIYDILALTPIVWGWMFGVGIIIAKHYDIIEKFTPKFYLFLLPIFILIFTDLPGVFHSTGNELGLFYFLCYIGVIIWIAFGTKKIPLRFDISYGAYIWHMPIINLFLVMGWHEPLFALLLIIAISFTSWFFIEKPALRLKSASLKPL